MVDEEGKTHELVLIAGGETTRCEENWFIKNGNIQIDCNNVLPLQKPYLDQNNSRSNSKSIKPRAVTKHSTSGRTTIETWKRYLHKLRFDWVKPIDKTNFYSLENKIYLIADAYPVHHYRESIEYATFLSIELIKIPEGCTETFQPLDVRIFGFLSKEHVHTLIKEIAKYRVF